MKKILFPFDFSETSLNAFRYALRLADKTGASIVTLHVYELPIGTYTDYYDLLVENYDTTEWDKLEDFKAKVPRLNELIDGSGLAGIQISHLLEEGNAPEVIVAAAKREKADYIVMGSTGATGLTEIFLGSVTEKVMNDAECNVLAVPASAKFQLPASVLFLIDLGKYRYSQLRKVVEFADLFKARIDVLQIKQHHEKAEEEIVEKWKKQFAGRDVGFHIQTGLTADEVVMNFIDVAKTSVVAITTHHKSLMRRVFLYSLSQQLAFHTRVPVLGLRKADKR